MDKVKEVLTRKFGPLPVWAWTAVAFVGVWWYRNHSANAAASTDNQQQAASDQPSYYGPYGQSPAGIDGGGAGTTTSGDGSAGAPPQITVNYPGGKGRRSNRKKAGLRKNATTDRKSVGRVDRVTVTGGKGGKSSGKVTKLGGTKQQRSDAHARDGTRTHDGGTSSGRKWSRTRANVSTTAPTTGKGNAMRHNPAKAPGNPGGTRARKATTTRAHTGGRKR